MDKMLLYVQIEEALSLCPFPPVCMCTVCVAFDWGCISMCERWVFYCFAHPQLSVMDFHQHTLEDIGVHGRFPAMHFDQEGVVLDEMCIRNILHQVFLGVDFMHQCHIVHLDLSPSNILFSITQVMMKVLCFVCMCFTLCAFRSSLVWFEGSALHTLFEFTSNSLQFSLAVQHFLLFLFLFSLVSLSFPHH